jgi:Icc-related predicted phosphoesterase
LAWLRQAVESWRPEGILFAGGVLHPARRNAPRTATEWGMTSEDALFLERFLETLGLLGVFSVVIPGRVDTPLEHFLRLGMHAEMEFPSVHLAHATLVERDGIAVCGMGGCIHDWTVGEMDTDSRAVAEYHLRPLWTAKQPRTILMLANPLTGPLGGDEGSTVTDILIDSYHPSLCVVGGPSQRRGAQGFASTLVINPGHLADGWAAWLDWNRAADQQVEFLNLRDLEGPGMGGEMDIRDRRSLVNRG